MDSTTIMFKLVVCCVLLAAPAFGVEFQIVNRLQGPIWIGILGNADKPPLENGGFELQAGEQRSVFSADDWAGRFWARTWCYHETNHCDTGDCGNRFECAGAGGVPPVSLAEITLRGWGGQDFYDISLVDGFNVPASIEPLGGTGDCKPVICGVDLNPGCPADLQLIGQNAGYTVGCMSDCLRYNSDEYCCRGEWGTPDKCPPPPSANYFKSNCPDAYSYAYDDLTSTFTCVASVYRVSFG